MKNFDVDALWQLERIGAPSLSPDGAQAVASVTRYSMETNKSAASLHLFSTLGGEPRRLTAAGDKDGQPQWSPNGELIAFIARREQEDVKDEAPQLYVIPPDGGEARRVATVATGVDAFKWFPDGRRLAFVSWVDPTLKGQDAQAKARQAEKDRKETAYVTEEGFYRFWDHSLPMGRVPHLHVVDIETGEVRDLFEGTPYELSRAEPDADTFDISPDGRRIVFTSLKDGDLDIYTMNVDGTNVRRLTTTPGYDGGPWWSPDGKQIAYISNHEKDPDQSPNDEIYLIDAHVGAVPRKLTSFYSGSGERLSWSRDGKLIAYVVGDDAKYNAYSMNRLAVVSVTDGSSRMLTGGFDRGVSSPCFTADGSYIEFRVPDDRSEYLARVAVSGGKVERLSPGDLVVYEKSAAAGHTALDVSTDASPEEIYALENGKLRKLTSHNDALLAEWQLGAVEDISFKSKDGTEIHGLMVKPPDYGAAKKYPLVVWIHGGPNGQDDHGLPFSTYPLQVERQIFAAQGYVVLAINYRGSNGRGAEFTRSIFADWGNKEIADLQAGVDWAISRGIADPDKLGIGGWSYGGILTDYMIASDQRFKAAISGAGSANQLSMYGSDQYILQYNNELGPPWKNQETWIKVSYPFFHADRIHTPTLFMGGQSDFNVPIIGGEQMYQALRTLGIPTELVIYPGQFHLFTRPSYIHDRLERYVAWFGRYLKN